MKGKGGAGNEADNDKSVVLRKARGGGIMKGHGIVAARICLLALAVLLLVFGSLNGGARDVFAKAAAVCSECIGLG